ncbi:MULTISPECIES: hypothetical protein [Mycobacteriaceae]|jgi:hypothetical protein|uniref:hypothetical protein n=1 Tax=Mycobacteriaceae TaxID=1762 RepID=UPI000740488A|nr:MULTISPECIES: hypothetical protein [Mycobacteriaceae]KUH85932.1 hypothetical protein AU186_10975 [Mycobacterium sp. GA-1999]KUH85939.1 hypothetical protein AU185_11655 [Mycobacterium sp. GA-0227b]OBF90990.1 hypothetical protein A5790_15800 [Mycobacterium sp. 852002-51152_SCH6134967]
MYGGVERTRHIVDDMVSSSPDQSRAVAGQPGEINDDLLNVAYARLAGTFNSEVADAERRTARDILVSRREL